MILEALHMRNKNPNLNEIISNLVLVYANIISNFIEPNLKTNATTWHQYKLLTINS